MEYGHRAQKLHPPNGIDVAVDRFGGAAKSRATAAYGFEK
jgi:hypothetical protein